MPMTSGRNGSFFLRSAREQALGGEAPAPLLEQLEQRADPGELDRIDDSWYFERPGKVVRRPVHTTSMPSSGLMPSRIAVVRQHTASSTASLSFSAK